MVIMLEDCDFSDTSQELKNPPDHIAKATVRFSDEMEQTLSVSFNPMVIIYEHIPFDDFTPEEIEASWFTSAEYKQIRESIKEDVKLMETGQLVESRHRGLENRTKQGMRRKLYFRQKAYEAVFAEINYQYEEGILDEDTIAESYHFACRSTTAIGQKMARIDAREAIRVYRSNKKDRVYLDKEKVMKLRLTTSIAAWSPFLQPYFWEFFRTKP